MAKDPKILTEAGWKTAARGIQVRDKELRRALAAYQDAGDEDHELRRESMAKVCALAATLKRDKEVASAPELLEYLTKLISAAQTEQREARAGAERALAEAEDSDEDDEDEVEVEEDVEEDDDEPGAYEVKLEKSLDKLKKAKKPFHFVVCEAKPHCVLMVSQGRITSAKLKPLIEVSGGSKRFLKPGTCTREGNRLIFEMKNPPPGLARKIVQSLRHFIGKKFAVSIGDEFAEDEGPLEAGVDEGAELTGGDAGAVEGARLQPARAGLEKTPEVWSATQRIVKSRVEQLKAAVRKAFATEGPDAVAEIEQDMEKLDAIFEQLDDELADLLELAAASDGAARSAALQSARTLLAEHIQFVKDEPMIAHIDSNPFDVATDLQGTLTKSLRHLVQVIGGERGR